MENIYLKPGDMVVRNDPVKITTVLGSCIALTLFASRLRMGAICHALLPACNEMPACRDRRRNPYKYVDCVIPEMVQALLSSGATLRDLEVKLFGGADMFSPGRRNGFLSVGGQNIAAAVHAVAACDLRIKLKDVGSNHGRKIYFFPHTGEVWMKRLGLSRRPEPDASRAVRLDRMTGQTINPRTPIRSG